MVRNVAGDHERSISLSFLRSGQFDSQVVVEFGLDYDDLVEKRGSAGCGRRSHISGHRINYRVRDGIVEPIAMCKKDECEEDLKAVLNEGPAADEGVRPTWAVGDASR